MTPAHKEVTRITDVIGERGRPIVVTISPEGVWYRLKGRRTRYLVPHSHGYFHAARLEGDRIRREKAAARKAKKSSRSSR